MALVRADGRPVRPCGSGCRPAGPDRHPAVEYHRSWGGVTGPAARTPAESPQSPDALWRARHRSLKANRIQLAGPAFAVPSGQSCSETSTRNRPPAMVRRAGRAPRSTALLEHDRRPPSAHRHGHLGAAGRWARPAHSGYNRYAARLCRQRSAVAVETVASSREEVGEPHRREVSRRGGHVGEHYGTRHSLCDAVCGNFH